jgi:SNF2 family DNA or RNA helicase
LKTLHSWQEADVEEALQHDSWFCAYEMSLGKTLVTVEWAKRKGINTAIIVAPLNTFESWRREFKSQWPDMPVYFLKNDSKNVIAFKYLHEQKRGIYLIGWEMMRTGAITGERADLAVADETHKQANFNKSDQSVLIREFDSKYKIALSGTPAGNRPDGIFGTLNWLWPKKYSSYWKWCEKYWRSLRNGSVITLVREIEPGAIVRDIPMFTRRLVKDHRADMPKRLPEIEIPVDLTPGQWKLYNRLAKEAGVWVGDEDSDDEVSFISTSVKLVEDMRLREIALAVPSMVDGKVTFKENAKSSKISALLEVLDNPELQDQGFLVLTHSAKVVPVIVAQLAKKGIKAYGFTGDTKLGDEVGQRQWLLDSLGSEYRVLVAGIAAIAEGTDGLQHKCHNMFWLSKHPNWTLNTQAGQRLDRPGQMFPINEWYTYAPGTVDENSIRRLNEIGESLEAMLDAK